MAIVNKDPFCDELISAILLELDTHLPAEGEKKEMLRQSKVYIDHWYGVALAIDRARAKKKLKLVVTPWVWKKIKKLPKHINMLVPKEARQAMLQFVRELVVDMVSDSLSKSITEMAE